MPEQNKDDLARALEALSASSAAEEQMSGDPHDSPASSQEAVAPEPSRAIAAPTHATSGESLPRSLELKRTAIPTLLVLSAALPLGGLASLLMGDDSPLGDGAMLPVLMIALGLLIALATTLTILQVRQALTAKSAR